MRILGTLILSLMMVGFLTGIAKPQIVSLLSDRFADNEYPVISVNAVDQLGLLFEAVQKFDTRDNPLLISWQRTSIVLFPKRTIAAKLVIDLVIFHETVIGRFKNVLTAF